MAIPVVLGACLLTSTGMGHSSPTADNLHEPVDPTLTNQGVTRLPTTWYRTSPVVTHTVTPPVHHTPKPPKPTVTYTPEAHVTATTRPAPPVVHSSGSLGARVLAYAESQMGVPYVYGGESPGVAFDCSGLVQWAYAQAGASVPRVTEDQFNYFKMIPKSQARPGDLVFFHNDADPSSYVYHVGIYVGNNDMMVVAPDVGLDVQIQNFDWGGDTVTFGTLDIS